MKPIEDNAAAKILLWTVLAAYLMMALALAATDIELDYAAAAQTLGLVSCLIPFLLYARWRAMVVLPESFACIAAVLALAVPIVVWTYAAMNVAMPLADAQLVSMDAALGFDWGAFIAFVDSRPTLARALALSYSSFPYQLLLLPFLLALSGRGQRAYAMVFAYALVGLVSSLVSVWYPALGTYVIYGMGAEQMANINAKFGFFFLEQFHAVRAEGPFTLVIQESAGIVTFPSVHAAVAAICAWAAWDVRILRYPLLALNLMMAVSAISHANHYLIDVVAGIGVAAACISVTICVFYRPEAKRSPVLRTVTRMGGLLRRRPQAAGAG